MATVKEITVEVYDEILKAVDEMNLGREDILVLRVRADPNLPEKIEKLREELYRRYEWIGFVMLIECQDDMVGKLNEKMLFGLFGYLKERFHGEEWKLGGENG